MSDHVLVLTGGTGTVGDQLLAALATVWPGRLCAVGRARPARLPAGHDFLPCDLADPAATRAAAEHLADGSPITALVCAAGVDSRATLDDLTSDAFSACMQINCLAHLQLLRAASWLLPRPLPVVLVSSDVVGAPAPGTLVYAAAKAAAEEAFRHAAIEAPAPGIALLTVRLPDIGVPMRAAAPGPPPPPRTADQRPNEALAAAVAAITQFVTQKHAARIEEVWHA
ncbi:SDR family NAD(P)-dependent oxidoreductase [Actinoallomurus spadix]|uniref:Ketoreductase domain-containing protein n=1 Tax=Actinoallomurus spadix TaxID=79912 RepID=A0ABN0XBW7_9ACTN|nr:SDR family NAD(P)-dependent oxidoreductase [Actinoallomurus spadix]MCO5987720.1 SDR family NAD(P)-dependent oxidoreductase [Actinoallomurus spadix]